MSFGGIKQAQIEYYMRLRRTVGMPHLTSADCAAIDRRLGEVARTFKTGGSTVSAISIAIYEARALIRERVVDGKTHLADARVIEEMKA